MKAEIQVAQELKAKGYRYVVQFQTNGANFGEPLFLKTADMTGPMLRSFRPDENAKMAWVKNVDEYIESLK